jgi:hypothetical protein
MSGRKAKHEYTASHATDAEVLAASRKLTRRGFAVAAIGAAAGFGFYRWVEYSRDDGMQPVPLRRAFQANAALSRKVFDERALAPTYPASRAENLRINGLIGIKEAILPESWRLQLVGAANEKHFAQYVPDVTAWTYEYSRGSESTEGDHFTFVPPEPVVNRGNPIQVRAGKRSRGLEEAGPSYSTVPAGTPGLLLRMADITRLPAHDLVTEFKCVEGGVKSPIGAAFAWPTSSMPIRPRGNLTAAFRAMSIWKHTERGLLRWLLYDGLPSSADPARYRDGRKAADATARRAATSARAHQVWIQADQTHRPNCVYRPEAG